jgi:hypothetical protein
MKGENSVREYLESFMAEFEYPLNATDELLLAYDKLNSSSPREFSDMISEYNISNKINYELFEENIKQISKSADVNEYTGALVLLLCLTKRLREYYCESGISEDIYRNTVLDLRYKLDECICVHRVAGTFVLKWFWGSFRLERFALGRLQFELIDFGREYAKDGRTLSPGDKVINMHIPRTLTPFSPENCDDAFARGAEFFRPQLKGAPVVFYCSSWLLSDVHYQILHERSNVRRFMDRFDIFQFDHEPEGEHRSAWRIFDMDFTGSYDDYPEDSFIRRAYKTYIKNGGITGSGKGIFFYDN